MAEIQSGRVLRGNTHAKGVAAGKLVETVNSLTAEDFFNKYFDGVARAKLTSLATTLNLDVVLRDADGLENTSLEQCLKLIESSSKDDYAKSEMSWKPAAKRKEMQLPDMKYIILRSRDRQIPAMEPPGGGGGGCDVIVGFISFMITYEDGYEVVYIYEIHLASALRGRGAGKALVTAIEDIGRLVKVSKAMLTVFRSNEHAHQWYNRQGYTADEFSPSPKILRNGTVKESSYLILSKVI